LAAGPVLGFSPTLVDILCGEYLKLKIKISSKRKSMVVFFAYLIPLTKLVIKN
jgi:hypothetical protein